ncbi:MAG: RNA polymerase sigma factor [Bacteroidia bacterium]|nr:RNA polymerase sigma factor [Bacteroidia bacterium]
MTDELLLQKIIRGETQVLGVLYKRYSTLLFNYFYRVTKDYNASNDLLMETFARIHKYRHSYKPSRKVRPWIFQIGSNLLKDHLKKISKTISIHESDVQQIGVQPDRYSEISDRQRRTQQAMARLKLSERNIVTQYYLLEMSYEAIAETENITVNNARIKVCRALKKLKALLKDIKT